MTRALVILPLLLAACAHQQRTALPLTDSCNTTTCHGTRCETTTLACSVPLDVDVDEDAPLDEGGGGYLPIPYYVEHAALGQAMPPVGSPSWLAKAWNYEATATQGLATSECLFYGGSGTTGVCLGGRPGGGYGALYLGITPSTRTTGNYTLASDGTTLYIHNGSHVMTGSEFQTPALSNTSPGASALFYSKTNAATATATVPAFKLLPLVALDADDAVLDVQKSDGVSLLKVDTEGDLTSGSLRVSSTAALPTCAATIEGTLKRDGTTGAASTARTRVCLCTSDGAATPAYQWINAVSGTVGTATTCPL